MSEDTQWAIPQTAQPRPDEWAFDLERALASVVAVRAEVPKDAFTASILGTERAGNGVVIDQDGLILTIGYLITEADSIWLTALNGAAAPAHVVGYDQATGFGLIQALGRLGAPPLELGTAAASGVGDPVIIAGEGGMAHALKASVVSKREFAGYWEYVLDEAISTAPAHPSWGGTAVIGPAGELIGIGSLQVERKTESGEEAQLNMIVPTSLLTPILPDLVTLGRVDQPPRPWLGMYASEAEDTVFVAGVASGGPADRAGVKPGDFVLEVAGTRVTELAATFRRIWSIGPAGSPIPLTIARDGNLQRVTIHSADRNDFLKKPRLH